MPKYHTDLDNVFIALADPTRRMVLARLCQGEATVSELAEPFDMALPSFTQHLKVMEQSGLVESEKIGRSRTYRVVPAQLQRAENWLQQQYLVWEARLDRLDRHLMTLKQRRSQTTKRQF